jgi:hypothetical protein
MLATVEGVYRNGKIEVTEAPQGLSENAPVIVTFMHKHYVDLKDYNISEAEAAELRARLLPFAQEWDSPEMELYDEYDRSKNEL